jgi:hypothetical protein
MSPSTVGAVHHPVDIEAFDDGVTYKRSVEVFGISSEESSEYPVGATARSRADVIESAVAKRVTSTPHATRPSVNNKANCSQGP